jgi:hypothetical protein
MTCNNKCEIVEWNVSNPQLVKEVTSPNVSIDDTQLLAMATKQIVKENTSRKAIGCTSGCECVQVGEFERVWSGDIYKKTIITGTAPDGSEWKAEFLFKLCMRKIRFSGECVPIDQHIEPIHVEIEPMP